MTKKDTAKTILCYGDSNTWGAMPLTNDRYPRSIRWPGALQNILGDKYDVISEGLCGRTLVAHDHAKPWRTGITHVQALIASADPCDLVIIMLGTNDIKTMYSLKPDDIPCHLEEAIRAIRDPNLKLSREPKILIICPPKPVEPTQRKIDERMTRWPEFFTDLPDQFKSIAEKYGCEYINAADHITSSRIDGYHLDPEAHLALAQVISKKILFMGI